MTRAEAERLIERLREYAKDWRERAEAALSENERLRKALDEFGTSRVRDRVASRVGGNHDILHDALQQEVRRAREDLAIAADRLSGGGE